MQKVTPDHILPAVHDALRRTPIVDIHTHLFSPQLGSLGLWGIDQLLTYHYLEAELFRTHVITPEAYWQLNVTKKADLIWKTLFLDREPPFPKPPTRRRRRLAEPSASTPPISNKPANSSNQERSTHTSPTSSASPESIRL